MVRIAGVAGGDLAPEITVTLERIVAAGFKADDDLVGLEVAAGAALGAVARASRSGELRAQQPIVAAGGLVVVADARLDNRDWLANTLAPSERTRPEDAHLVALAHHRWGARAAEHLEGDFAFIVWDPATRTMIAARDGVGVRPLYFAQLGDRLWVASQVEQLLCVPGLPTDLDDGAVLDYLTGQALQNECSMFASIHRVLPGHCLVFRRGLVRQSRYWHPRDEISRDAPRDAEAAFVEALDGAVSSRLESDHPVMIYMSGGLDSSGIACLADRQCEAGRGPGTKVVAASAIYPGLSCDESAAIQELASGFRQIGHTTWNGTEFDPANFQDPSPDWPGSRVIFAGGSTGDLKIARRLGARVFLSGEGGDEICTDVGVAPELVRSGAILTAIRETLLLEHHPLRWRLTRLRRGISSLAPPLLRRARRRLRHLRAPAWLAPRMRELWAERLSACAARTPPTTAAEVMADMIASHELTLAIESIQAYSARAGAEVRFPYLDRRVISVSASLTLEQRRPHGMMRGFQRRALKGLVPDPVRMRPIVFLADARMGEAKRMLPFIRDQVASRDWLSEQYVTRGGAASIVSSLESAAGFDRGAWITVGNLGTLEAWLRRRQALAAR